MGDLVNLRRARKAVTREVEARRAEANRLKHGRAKAERRVDELASEMAERRLDQHRRDS